MLLFFSPVGILISLFICLFINIYYYFIIRRGGDGDGVGTLAQRGRNALPTGECPRPFLIIIIIIIIHRWILNKNKNQNHTL
jgi:hypothetical protein